MATVELLADDTNGKTAQELARAFTALDGAALAADSVESVLR